MSVLGMVSAIRRAAVYVRYGLIADIHGSDANGRSESIPGGSRPHRECLLFEGKQT